MSALGGSATPCQFERVIIQANSLGTSIKEEAILRGQECCSPLPAEKQCSEWHRAKGLQTGSQQHNSPDCNVVGGIWLLSELRDDCIVKDGSLLLCLIHLQERTSTVRQGAIWASHGLPQRVQRWLQDHYCSCRQFCTPA